VRNEDIISPSLTLWTTNKTVGEVCETLRWRIQTHSSWKWTCMELIENINQSVNQSTIGTTIYAPSSLHSKNSEKSADLTYCQSKR